ncbi:unnamed protein product [Parnassius apollo]|uniref:(apollo) hypothetical protein n=1 Tax=Parnassius apollo TaxID=110799 RepID=A0A8S3W710_PARAO|nr:unnamed protein product [Parnassius apollo]
MASSSGGVTRSGVKKYAQKYCKEWEYDPNLKVMMQEMISDVGDAAYSLIVDETTDISTDKILCIMIRDNVDPAKLLEDLFLLFKNILQIIVIPRKTFVVILCSELQKSLPKQITFLKAMVKLSPEIATFQVKPTLVDILQTKCSKG